MKKRKNKRSDRPKKVIVVNVTPKKRKIRILDLETDEAVIQRYLSGTIEIVNFRRSTESIHRSCMILYWYPRGYSIAFPLLVSRLWSKI